MKGPESEPPPSARQQDCLTVSSSDVQYPTTATPVSHHLSLDDSLTSPVASIDRFLRKIAYLQHQSSRFLN